MKCKYCGYEISSDAKRCPQCDAPSEQTEKAFAIRFKNEQEAQKVITSLKEHEIPFTEETVDGIHTLSVESSREQETEKILFSLDLLESAEENDPSECPPADFPEETASKKPSLLATIVGVLLFLLVASLAVFGTDILMAWLKQLLHIR